MESMSANSKVGKISDLMKMHEQGFLDTLILLDLIERVVKAPNE